MRSTDLTARALLEVPGHDGRPCRVHTVAFEDADEALNAAIRLKHEGFEIVDVHSPCPIHGLDEALGWRETRLGYVSLVGGLVGLGVGVALQAYTHGFDWPLDIGGKTNLAWPAMVPVIFELTILIAAYATVFGLFFRRRLRPRWNPGKPIGQPGPGVTDNRFVILVLEQDGSFSSTGFAELCDELRPVEVVEGWKVFS